MTLLIRLTLTVSLVTVVLVNLVNAGKVELAISHVNDVNGQIQSFKKGSHNSSKAPEPCTDDIDPGTCVGGFLNVVHWLFERNDFNFGEVPEPNFLMLSSGNIIGGESGWISAVENGWARYAKLVKEYMISKPAKDFTALGMKEFGAGVLQAKTFASELKGLSGVANTCDDVDGYTGNEKAFCDLFESKYKTVELTGTDGKEKFTIGIIGFVTQTVEQLSLPGQLKFSSIPETIKKITDNAKDIDIFIAVGDGTLAISKEILENASKVKLVVYGAGLSNTHTDEYPLIYNEGIIATAGRYGSSVGKLHLEIDTDTKKIEVKAKTLKETITPEKLNADASKAVTEVNTWHDEVKVQMGKFIGHTRVPLVGGETCWRNECITGNLMTDAVVHCVLNRFELDKPFPHVLHSIWHGGAFFEDKVEGKISEFDVHKWLPYHNNVHLVKVTGSNLRKVFQASAKGIEPGKFGDKDWRQFLQVSNGFEVFYDTQSDTPKATHIRIVHDNNGVPQFADLDDNKDYYLAIPTYLFEKRGVYNFTEDIWTAEEIPPAQGSGQKNVFDDQCLEDYIIAMKHISVGLEERIWINKDNGDGGSTEAPGTTNTPPTTKPTTGGTGEPTSGTTEGPCPTDGPAPPPPTPCPKRQKTAVTVTLTIVFYTITLGIGYVGYFYVLPRLRRPPLSEQYPPNQL